MTKETELAHQRLLNYQSYLVIGFLGILALIVVPEREITIEIIVLILVLTTIFLILLIKLHNRLKQIEQNES